MSWHSEISLSGSGRPRRCPSGSESRPRGAWGPSAPRAGLARAGAVFRTALFSPVVTTVVAVAVIWRYLFHARHGFLNYALGWFGIDAIDWLGDPRWSMPAIIVFAVWKNFGSNMIVFLAALQAIPEEP